MKRNHASDWYPCTLIFSALQLIEANPWYNWRKRTGKNPAKTLHLEGNHVSLQQWTDQLGGFQTAGGHESEGKQPLGKESPDDPLAGD